MAIARGIDIDKEAKIYDIDLFDVSQDLINKLHNKGKIVICYFSAGSYESWREDSELFPQSVLGNPLQDWEGERWLDIRNESVREIMKKRLDLAVQKKCDGVEPDNVDGYLHNSGFGLNYEDQLEYNRFLSNEAHKRGLLIGLKNDLNQINELVDYFDFAVNEECFEYNECEKYKPFLTQNKAVLNAEYKILDICNEAKNLGISSAFYNKELNGSFYDPCF